jgi:hypothetical protein
MAHENVPVLRGMLFKQGASIVTSEQARRLLMRL